MTETVYRRSEKGWVTRMSHNAHAITVVPLKTKSGDNWYVPVCSCGWEGPEYFEATFAAAVPCDVAEAIKAGEIRKDVRKTRAA